MRIYPYIFTLSVVIASCNTDEPEIPCNCNEIKDKRINFVQNAPYEFEFYVEDCETLQKDWVMVTQDEFNNNNLGDCWE